MVKLKTVSDTLIVIVNHWPSRVGGEEKTDELRAEVAGRLKQISDSVLAKMPRAKIIITGDLNDEPTDASLTKSLCTLSDFKTISGKKLYNLTSQTFETGSHKYKGRWYTFDQIIVSGNLLVAKCGLATNLKSVHIFNNDLVLETDEKNMGKHLIPTFVGPKYVGGYSDHLPVYVDLFIKK
jgi:hypothetical protein